MRNEISTERRVAVGFAPGAKYQVDRSDEEEDDNQPGGETPMSRARPWILVEILNTHSLHHALSTCLCVICVTRLVGRRVSISSFSYTFVMYLNTTTNMAQRWLRMVVDLVANLQRE